jgi:hypothetical protein
MTRRTMFPHRKRKPPRKKYIEEKTKAICSHCGEIVMSIEQYYSITETGRTLHFFHVSCFQEVAGKKFMRVEIETEELREVLREKEDARLLEKREKELVMSNAQRSA